MPGTAVGRKLAPSPNADLLDTCLDVVVESEVWVTRDELGTMQQLGLVPQPQLA